MKTVVEILQDAKNLLMERGRYKGAYKNSKGPEVCLVGAVVEISKTANTPKSFEAWLPYDEAIRLLAKQVNPLGFTHVGSFNDHPDTTDGDVFAVLDNAIIAAKELGMDVE